MTGIYPQFHRQQQKGHSAPPRAPRNPVPHQIPAKNPFLPVSSVPACTQMSAGVWFYLSSFHFFRGHDNNSGILLEHHPPEIIHRVLQAALGSNITFFWLWVVALGFKLRLEGGKRKKKHPSNLNNGDKIPLDLGKRRWEYTHHNNISIDIVWNGFVGITVVENNSGVINCKNTPGCQAIAFYTCEHTAATN